MYKKLRIHFGKNSEFYLDFVLDNSPVVQLWVERMENRGQWKLDDPTRFYGFDSPSAEKQKALHKINQCIVIINSYQPIINRSVSSVDDQDTLNYLHNIFERYHGMLDCQHHEYWQSAPLQVRQALAELNIAVHRCESAQLIARPRFVCTWWGMPKEKILSDHIKQYYGTPLIEFGGVYLNYVEIGKTMLDLATDDDQYIADEMFQPFNFYSADFVTYFYSSQSDELERNQKLIDDYFNRHVDFFNNLGITNTKDIRTRQLRYKVAQLQDFDQSNVIDKIRNNQYINSVELL